MKGSIKHLEARLLPLVDPLEYHLAAHPPVLWLHREVELEARDRSREGAMGAAGEVGEV